MRTSYLKAIALAFLCCLFIVSCKKEDQVPPSSAMQERLLGWETKYRLQKSVPGQQPFAAVITVTDKNVDSIEQLLQQIQTIKVTAEQLDAIEKDFIKTFSEKYKTGTALRLLTWYTDVELKAAPSWLMTATTRYGPASTGLPIRITPWLVSGLIPGSGTTPPNHPIVDQLAPPSQGVTPFRATWLYLLQAQVVIPGGTTFPIGYVLRCVGYYNVGEPIPSYNGNLTLS